MGATTQGGTRHDVTARFSTTGEDMAEKAIKEPQHIVRLDIENIKRIQVASIEVDPSGGLIIIGGKNGDGKSSAIDSILYTLVDKRKIPGDIISHGRDKGNVRVETESLIIERTMTKSSNVLKVTLKDAGGVEVRKPQDIIRAITQGLAFDPLRFMYMKPSEQASALRDLVGLDFTDVDSRRDAAVENRKVTKRSIKGAETLLDTLTCDATIGYEETSASGILAEIEDARKHNEAISAIEKTLEDANDRIEKRRTERSEVEEKISGLQAEILKLQAKVEGIGELIDAELAKIDSISKRLALPEMERKDISVLVEKLNTVEAHNAAVRKNVEYQRQFETLEKLKDELKGFEDSVRECDDERAAMIAEAQMPIDGLSFDDDGNILYKGARLHNCSTSEGLEVSVSISIATHPDLAVMLVKDGDKLDDDSLARLRDIAIRNGIQIWLERVMSDSDKATIFFEEGRVV